MKKISAFLLVLSCAFLLVACGNGDEGSKGKNNNNNNNAEENAPESENNAPNEIVVNDDEKVEDEKVVVKVNDKEVTGVDYNLVYLQAKMHLMQSGQDPEDQELAQELTMGSLIEQELIKWDAEKEGIEISSEDVQSEYDKAKKENEEELNAYLKQFNLTEDTYKDRLYFAMIHEEYLASVITIPEVTDEEIAEVYEMLKEDDSEIPELEAVKDQLKMELSYQKETEQLQAKIQELEAAADIEKMI